MSKLIDLTGQRFGKLTVIERALNSKYGEARWKCKCDCGNETIVYGKSLRLGRSKSCGSCGGKHQRSNINIGEKYGKLLIIE